jgi:Ser/Thr protein kinase RdoA (MazF antagonist)
MHPDERPLTGGRTTSNIIRVGDTVRRPPKANAAFVREFLGYLASRGFTGAPRFKGVDEFGREILSYLEGEVPSELGSFSEPQVAEAARLLRGLHDYAAGWDGRGEEETVCHGDASPCNTVFLQGVPRAFIDFDTAHPGSRREDVGYAAWLWLDVGNDELDPRAQGRRVSAFVRAYGSFPGLDALPAILDAQEELSQRDGAPAGVRRWAAECRRWTETHAGEMELGLQNTGAA